MSLPSEGVAKPDSKRGRRVIVVIVVVAIVVGALLAMMVVPYYSESNEIQVSPATTSTTELTVRQAGWVQVHFDHRSGMAMHYWIQGSSGLMFDHSMMAGSDSYSFWTWGGTFHCGASYIGSESSLSPVWVNATWGIL